MVFELKFIYSFNHWKLCKIWGFCGNWDYCTTSLCGVRTQKNMTSVETVFYSKSYFRHIHCVSAAT